MNFLTPEYLQQAIDRQAFINALSPGEYNQQDNYLALLNYLNSNPVAGFSEMGSANPVPNANDQPSSTTTNPTDTASNPADRLTKIMEWFKKRNSAMDTLKNMKYAGQQASGDNTWKLDQDWWTKTRNELRESNPFPNMQNWNPEATYNNQNEFGYDQPVNPPSPNGGSPVSNTPYRPITNNPGYLNWIK